MVTERPRLVGRKLPTANTSQQILGRRWPKLTIRPFWERFGGQIWSQIRVLAGFGQIWAQKWFFVEKAVFWTWYTKSAEKCKKCCF